MTTDPNCKSTAAYTFSTLPPTNPDPPFRCCRAGDPIAGHAADVGHDPTAPAVLPCVLAPGANLPRRGRPDDAGLDLTTPDAVTLPPGGFARIETGVSVAIPPGHAGQLWCRSGLAANGVVLLGGLLDSNFRGPIGVVLANLGGVAIEFAPGDRIAQMVVAPYLKLEPMMIDRLPSTDRGAAGWGSSGK